jgi:hypothetical protein
MTWTIEPILRYPDEKPWGQGYAHYGFHDHQGHRYFFDYFHHWIGRLGQDDEFLWTAGVRPDVMTGFHMDADFVRPMFLTEALDGSLPSRPMAKTAGVCGWIPLGAEGRKRPCIGVLYRRCYEDQAVQERESWFAWVRR